MEVFIYRSDKKQGFYLYLPQRDNFSAVPKPLLQALGALEYSMQFTLGPERSLAKEDPVVVLDNLKKLGFHLQITDPLKTPDIFKLR